MNRDPKRGTKPQVVTITAPLPALAITPRTDRNMALEPRTLPIATAEVSMEGRAFLTAASMRASAAIISFTSAIRS